MNNLNKTRVLLFILAQVFFSSCNAQIKSNAPKANAAIATKHPKITKPKGSDEYDCIGAGLQDKSGSIWFGNWFGTFIYDGKTFNKFAANGSTKFVTTNGDKIGNIRFMKADKKGNIWFVSNNDFGGLYLYNGEAFTHFTTKNGLTGNGVSGILEDKDGNLWIGTSNTGLCRYDGKNFSGFSE